MGYSSDFGYYFVIGLVLGCCVCSGQASRTCKLIPLESSTDIGIYSIMLGFGKWSFFPDKLPEKRSGLCPQPNCAMNVNCAPSYDCCDFGGSMFCVPGKCIYPALIFGKRNDIGSLQLPVRPPLSAAKIPTADQKKTSAVRLLPVARFAPTQFSWCSNHTTVHRYAQSFYTCDDFAL